MVIDQVNNQVIALTCNFDQVVQ